MSGAGAGGAAGAGTGTGIGTGVGTGSRRAVPTPVSGVHGTRGTSCGLRTLLVNQMTLPSAVAHVPQLSLSAATLARPPPPAVSSRGMRGPLSSTEAVRCRTRPAEFEHAAIAVTDMAVDIGQQFLDTFADGRHMQVEPPVPKMRGDDAPELRNTPGEACSSTT